MWKHSDVIAFLEFQRLFVDCCYARTSEINKYSFVTYPCLAFLDLNIWYVYVCYIMLYTICYVMLHVCYIMWNTICYVMLCVCYFICLLWYAICLFYNVFFVLRYIIWYVGNVSFISQWDIIILSNWRCCKIDLWSQKNNIFISLVFIGKSQSEKRLKNTVSITPKSITTYNSLHQKHILKTSWLYSQLCLARWQLVNHIRQLLNTKGNSQKTIQKSFHIKSYFIRALPIRRTNRQITAKANYMKTDKRHLNIIQTNERGILSSNCDCASHL